MIEQDIEHNKVEFEHGIIYHGDCFDILPTIQYKSCEIAITSPPYNLNKSHGYGGNTGMKERYQNWYPDEINEYEYIGQQKHLIYLLNQICRSSIFYNHRPRMAWHPRNKIQPRSKCFHPWMIVNDFPVWQEIVWNRGTWSNPAKNRCHITDERIYQINKPLTWKNPNQYTSIWKINPSKDEHVCSFPISIPHRCIELTTEKQQTIIDPYMGIGTTCIAAIKTNRRFIGIEKDKKYFDIAVKKIKHQYKQLTIPGLI